MKKNQAQKKLSLKEFVWYGFNYSVGIGFIGNFAILSNQGQNYSFGINAIWVYLIIGFVAGNCAWGFAKLAKIHNSDSNGAAYIYVRTTFGRFFGWLVGFMQYVCLPFLIMIQILFLIRGTFSAEFASGNAQKWYTVQWGNFSDLYLDLIGIVIYLSAASAIFGGIKLYKKLSNWTILIKWFTASFLIIAAFGLSFANAQTNFNHWTSFSKPSLGGFINTFNSCFFFFAGFEIFATAGENIENPEKNIAKGIVLTILFATIFYILISVLFFLAYSRFEQNMNMGAWLPFKSKLIIYGGPILMIISSLALKINGAMQNALYGATTLQPLSKEGYISGKMFKLNNDGIPVKAAFMNLAITVFMLIIWLIIPDLIKGFWLNAHPGGHYESAFNVSSLTSASSVITLFIYLMVLLVVFKLAVTKKIKLNLYEKIIFPIVILFLLALIFIHYFDLVKGVVDAYKTNSSDSNSVLVGALVELVFIFVTLLFAVIWYFTYYKRKFDKRMLNNPEIQETLDETFTFNDDHQRALQQLEQEQNV